MTKGKAIPEELCWTVLRLSEIHTPLEILGLTHVSLRQQSRIVHRWKTTGDVVPPKAAIEQRGRMRHLTMEEAYVSTNSFLAALASQLSLTSLFKDV